MNIHPFVLFDFEICMTVFRFMNGCKFFFIEFQDYLHAVIVSLTVLFYLFSNSWNNENHRVKRMRCWNDENDMKHSFVRILL